MRAGGMAGHSSASPAHGSGPSLVWVALRALSACCKYVRANDASPPFAADASKELGQLLMLTKASCAR
jgi:hypothetical protein